MNEGGAGSRAAVAWACQSFAKLLIANTQTGPIPSNNPKKTSFSHHTLGCAFPWRCFGFISGGIGQQSQFDFHQGAYYREHGIFSPHSAFAIISSINDVDKREEGSPVCANLANFGAAIKQIPTLKKLEIFVCFV